MIRNLPLILCALFVVVQTGCAPAARPQADQAVDDTVTAYESVLVKFKTVVDDETAREELQSLNQLHDDFVASLTALVDAQKKSYATGGGLSDADKKMSQYMKTFNSEFKAHRESLPDSTLAILKPFFEKGEQLLRSPIK